MTIAGYQTILMLIPFLLLYIAIPTLLLSLLQLFLCRKELKWGRILPIFSIAVSLLMLLFLLFFSVQAANRGDLISVALAALFCLLILNVPTLIYYLIYRAEKKRRLQTDVNRTRIDDLE